METSLLDASVGNIIGEGLLQIPAALAEVLPRDMNKAIRDVIKEKNKVLHIKLDRATRHGQDPETLEAEDVRQGGLSLSTISDLHRTFTGISPLDCVIQLNAGAENVALLALFEALFQANGLKISNLKGTIGANPLPVLFEDGTLPVELEAIYGNIVAGICWAEKKAPALCTVMIDSSFYAKWGMDKAGELGLALAEAVTYQQAVQKHGVAPDIFVRHLQIMLSGAAEEENVKRIKVFKLLWQEVQAESLALPLLAILEGGDSQFAAGAMQDKMSEVELKEAAFKVYQAVMQQGGLDKAMQTGYLQKKVIAARNACLKSMAQAYDDGKLTWPAAVEQRIDTAYIKDVRMTEIVEYQKEIDELEKSRYLARTVRMNTAEDIQLIDMAKEAFFAGASLADVVIALHTDRSDCYLDNVIDCKDVLQEFVELRNRTEAAAEEYGRLPSFVICDVWQSEQDYVNEAVIWQEIFAPAGLRTEIYKENKLPEEIAGDIINLGASAVLLLLPQGRLAQSGMLERELRYLNSDLQIFVAEIGASINNYVYPRSWVKYLTSDQATCLDLLTQEDF